MKFLTQIRNELATLVLCHLIALSAFSAIRAQEQSAFSNQESTDTTLPSDPNSDYILRPNDLVSVSVFQEADLATRDRVAADGTIMMALVGRVKVAGKTVITAGEIIKGLLQKDFLVNPQVTMSLVEHSKQLFTALGQVASPGTYELPQNGSMSLLQAIGRAGGFSRLANPSKITIKRVVGNREQVFKVDGKKLAGQDGVTPFTVLPGDVITVAESLF
jgi:polysaccharide export outer membrane protein